jgi:hypothetical protein
MCVSLKFDGELQKFQIVSINFQKQKLRSQLEVQIKPQYHKLLAFEYKNKRSLISIGRSDSIEYTINHSMPITSKEMQY